MEANGTFDVLPKKEVIKIKKEYDKLNSYFCGVRNMKKLPDAMIITDPKKEYIAITEPRKLGIPVFGIVDTNCDPDLVDYVIPGNDDAVRAVKLVMGVLTNAIAEVNGNEVVDYVTEDDKDNKKNVKKEAVNEVKEEVKKEEKKVFEEDLNTLTLSDLKNRAKEAGIKGYSAMKKAELIEALEK